MADRKKIDYKQRMENEFYQMRRRVKNLRHFIYGRERAKAKIVLKYPDELLYMQLTAMEDYMRCLRMRCEAEGIELKEEKHGDA